MKAWEFIDYMSEEAKKYGLTIERVVVRDLDGTSSRNRIVGANPILAEKYGRQTMPREEEFGELKNTDPYQKVMMAYPGRDGVGVDIQREPFDFGDKPKSKCQNCGKLEEVHKASNRACPIGQRHRSVGYTSFHKSQKFKAKVKK